MSLASALARRAVLAGLLLMPAGWAVAGESRPFTPQALAAAKASGKPVLIEVTASWCYICAAQKPVIASLSQKPDFAAMQVLVVDFDSQKDALRALGAQRQSTLIVFRGDKETGRSVGVTNPAAIEALLRTAL